MPAVSAADVGDARLSASAALRKAASIISENAARYLTHGKFFARLAWQNGGQAEALAFHERCTWGLRGLHAARCDRS
jgi:hypothetical protein